MPRYKLLIEYDGAPFVGWQMQASGLSVQGVLAEAIAAFAGERATVRGAGRTDAGVHALGQVAHVDLAQDWDAGTVRDAINAHLRPHPIAVLAAETAPETFDARFSAAAATIAIASSTAVPTSTLDRGRAWRVPRPLDHAAMHGGRAASRRESRFHDVPRHPMPGQIAGEDARPARGDARWRRDRRRGGGALVPAHAGALDGRRAGCGRRRPLERRRPRRRAGGPRPHRLRPAGAAGGACISCAWNTERRYVRSKYRSRTFR